MLSRHSDEFRLIEAVREREPVWPSVACGIGDDAAVLEDGTLVATDTLLEGTHYLAGAAPSAVGHKAIAVNLSDIAAMAGTPIAATVALTLRRTGKGLDRGDRIMSGLQATAAEFDVAVVGGDTTSWDGPEAVTVTVIGRAAAGGAVLRRGAKPGDRLFVTGPLGGSLSGRHLRVVPRVREAARIRNAGVTAMIDLSDGLSSDAAHLATASEVRLVIDADAVPIHDDVAPDRDRLHAALTDGEDFELLFTAPPDAEPPGTHIGWVEAGDGVLLKLGETLRPLRPNGFSHNLGG